MTLPIFLTSYLDVTNGPPSYILLGPHSAFKKEEFKLLSFYMNQEKSHTNPDLYVNKYKFVNNLKITPSERASAVS